jgi:lysophospholipase L1-like esterase
MTTKPNDIQKTNIDNYIRRIKAGEAWDGLDFIAVPAFGHNSDGEALLWWNAPTKTMINNGCTFVANGGLKGNGSSAYFDTGYNPGGSIKFIQDDACYGIFYTGSGLLSNTVLIGANNNTSPRNELVYNTAGDHYCFINDDSITKATASDEKEGFLVISRLNSLQRIVSKNTIDETITASSIGRTNLKIYGCARNLAGTGPNSFSKAQIGLIFAGAGLTQSKIDVIKDGFVKYLSNLNNPLFKNFIAFGDSITYGSELSNPLIERYSYLVADNQSVREINLGIPGESLQFDFILRLDQFKYFDRNAKIFILGGINDIYYQIYGSGTLANFQTQYEYIIDTLVSYGYPANHIYIGTITYVVGERQSYLSSYNTVINSIASAKGCILVDTFTATDGHVEYLDVDGIHLNTAGHVVVKNTIIESL